MKNKNGYNPLKWLENFQQQRDKEKAALKFINQILPNGRVGRKSKQAVANLMEKTSYLREQTTRNWRRAEQMAIDVKKPRRYLLNNVYYDVMKDLHLIGVSQQRRLKATSQKFVLVDSANQPDSDRTKLLQRSWFQMFLHLAWESKLHGHSLVQLGDMAYNEKSKQLEFCNVSLVPRQHVVPEHGLILKDPTDEKGWSYKKGAWTKWVMEFGQPKDLGLLLAISPEALAKKNMMSFWDQFGEIFGMPIRIAKTASRNKDDHDIIESWLKEMGSAAYGLFPDGTDVEIKESTKGDAYNVFDKRILRANSEVSKALLTVTMTTDNGSSKSQSQTHAEMLEAVIDSDKKDMAYWINDELLPRLVMHGYPFADLEFRWDDTRELSLKDQMAVDKWIINNLEVEDDYYDQLSDRYGAPIIGKKNAIQE